MDPTVDMEPTERIRKFWTAHGRSVEAATVLVAMRNNRAVPWTPEHLCVWYGVRLDRAEVIMQDLESSGIIRRVGGGMRPTSGTPTSTGWGRSITTSGEASAWARRRRAGRPSIEP